VSSVPRLPPYRYRRRDNVSHRTPYGVDSPQLITGIGEVHAALPIGQEFLFQELPGADAKTAASKMQADLREAHEEISDTQ